MPPSGFVLQEIYLIEKFWSSLSARFNVELKENNETREEGMLRELSAIEKALSSENCLYAEKAILLFCKNMYLATRENEDIQGVLLRVLSKKY